MVVKADTPHSFGGKPYLKFEVSLTGTFNASSDGLDLAVSEPHNGKPQRSLATPMADLPRLQCPIQISLIDANLLTPKEKNWLNIYHQEVLQKVGPLLEQFGDARAAEWLKRMCQSVPEQ